MPSPWRILPVLLLLLFPGAAVSGQSPWTDHVFVYVDGTAPGPGSGTFNDPFPTIAAAMAYVIPHDYVWVRPGVYHEVVNLPYFIFLRSTDGPEATVIDATGLPGTHAVTVDTLGEVTGFSIRKDDGAGLRAPWTGNGGGPGPEYGRIIRGNRILGCPQGGMELEGAIHPVVAGNVVANCGPFGVRVSQGASPFFSGNTVTQQAIGIELQGTPPDAQSFFANSIVWGNTVEVAGLPPSRFRASDVGDPAFTGINGCFAADPLWVDGPGGDLRLTAGSPCIDVADPLYTLSSTDWDNRGYGAWRRMDGDHDGSVVPDVGAFERGGLQVSQTGAGAGSVLFVEVDTGPASTWFLAVGPLSDLPLLPFPSMSGPSPYLFLDPAFLVLFAQGSQGASGRTVLPLVVPSPSFVGLILPVQALGVAPSGALSFTNAEVLRIR